MFKVLLFIVIAINIYLTSCTINYVTNNEENCDDQQATAQFDNFIVNYGKKYNKEEYDRRLQIFKDNLNKINKWNAESPDTVFGINQFADLTADEVRSRYTGFRLQDKETNTTLLNWDKAVDVPDELDYRKKGYVTRVKDQGDCGSCYIFSAIGNIEGQYAKKHGKLVDLSEQQALDCDWKSDGCDGGLMTNTITSLKEQGGSMATKDYTPYQQKKLKCKTDKTKITAKVTGGGRLSITSEADVLNCLASTGPLSIGIFACDKFVHYVSGILRDACDPPLNHGVVLVGYGIENGTKYWIIKNSWGPGWGEKGYIRVEREKNLIGLDQFVVSADVA